MNNELYKTDIVDRIQFSWKGFKVNGSEMEKIKSTGEGEILTFDAFTFLSPIVKISKEEEEAKEEYFHSKQEIYCEIFCTCCAALCAALCAASLRDFPARRFGGQPPPPPLGLGIRLRDLKKPHFFGLYYPYIPYST